MTLTDGTVLNNKRNTEYGFGQQLSQPSGGVTGAAPTRRRRGAGPPRRSAEAVARPPLLVQEQGDFFRGTGNFCTRAGKFSTIPGTLSICITISFRRSPASSPAPTPPRSAPTPSPTPAQEQTSSRSRRAAVGQNQDFRNVKSRRDFFGRFLWTTCCASSHCVNRDESECGTDSPSHNRQARVA